MTIRIGEKRRLPQFMGGEIAQVVEVAPDWPWVQRVRGYEGIVHYQTETRRGAETFEAWRNFGLIDGGL